MISIYKKVAEDWKAYCLMSGIMLIEEMSKPKDYVQSKSYKGKINYYTKYRSLRLKVKELSIIKKWWEVTRKWENKLGIDLLTKFSKNGPNQEKSSKQYHIIFTPLWLFHVLMTTGRIPSKYTFDFCIKRLMSMTKRRSGTKYSIIPKKSIIDIIRKKSLYEKLIYDKYLSAGAFIVSFDLEFRGISTSEPSLCMTTKYEDFLNFMNKLANNCNWSTYKKLSEVNIEHSLIRGINATPKKEFRLKQSGLKEIYELAGPLMDNEKDEFARFHIKRSSRKKLFRKKGVTRKIILNVLKKGPNKSTEIQKYAGIRVDVVLDHLHNLEKYGFVSKKRNGKYYLWSLR